MTSFFNRMGLPRPAWTSDQANLPATATHSHLEGHLAHLVPSKLLPLP
jgi:hypothetical protein